MTMRSPPIDTTEPLIRNSIERRSDRDPASRLQLRNDRGRDLNPGPSPAASLFDRSSELCQSSVLAHVLEGILERHRRPATRLAAFGSAAVGRLPGRRRRTLAAVAVTGPLVAASAPGTSPIADCVRGRRREDGRGLRGAAVTITIPVTGPVVPAAAVGTGWSALLSVRLPADGPA